MQQEAVEWVAIKRVYNKHGDESMKKSTIGIITGRKPVNGYLTYVWELQGQNKCKW